MNDNCTLRQAMVKMPLIMIADALFGPGVSILGIATLPSDIAAETVTIVVSGHESLPVVAAGDALPFLISETIEHIHGVRSTEFRALASKGH